MWMGSLPLGSLMRGAHPYIPLRRTIPLNPIGSETRPAPRWPHVSWRHLLDAHITRGKLILPQTGRCYNRESQIRQNAMTQTSWFFLQVKQTTYHRTKDIVIKQNGKTITLNGNKWFFPLLNSNIPINNLIRLICCVTTIKGKTSNRVFKPRQITYKILLII